jgi:four helix bundle protein
LPLIARVGVSRIEDLVAWQLADAFKKEVYRILRSSPDALADVKYRDQLRVASASCAMNIAEGFYRFRPREFSTYLSIALASLGEAALWLRDGHDRGYFEAQACENAFRLATRCRVATLRLRQSLAT